jgi:hypothetical protein
MSDFVTPDVRLRFPPNDLRCSVCGSLEIAIVDGANEAHCLAHLPDQWRPLFQPPIFDPERTHSPQAERG